MRPTVLGFIAALVCATVPPAIAFAIAAPKREAAAPAAKGGNVTAASQRKGMAEAPAIMAGAGLTSCQLADANYIIDTNERIDGRNVKISFVEVACADGQGFVIGSRANGTYLVTDCLLEASRGTEKDPNILACRLPANAVPAKGLKPLLVKANFPCDPVDGNALGQTAAGATVYEIACADGSGARVLVDAPRQAPADVRINGCYDLMDTPNACTIVSAESLKAAVATLASKDPMQPCNVTEQRFMGATASGTRFYEFACEGASGIVVQTKNDGSYERTVACVQAAALGGGCKLSDSKVASTAENELYTRLAKGAGFNCDVKQYGAFPPALVKPGTEVVELACANRPDSAVAIFGATNEVLNCAQAESEGFPCSYSPKDAAHTQLTADLKKFKADSSCAVTDARPMGKNSTEAFVEVMCSDGFGSVVVYPLGVATPKQVLNCGQASGLAGGCKLKNAA